jgi:hypothetical protein
MNIILPLVQNNYEFNHLVIWNSLSNFHYLLEFTLCEKFTKPGLCSCSRALICMLLMVFNSRVNYIVPSAGFVVGVHIWFLAWDVKNPLTSYFPTFLQIKPLLISFRNHVYSCISYVHPSCLVKGHSSLSPLHISYLFLESMAWFPSSSFFHSTFFLLFNGKDA